MQVNGLPVHILLVHLVIVLVPAAALLLIGQAWSRPVRRWAGPLGPLLCLAAAVAVPVTTQAGYWLKRHLQVRTPLIDRHAHLGRQLLPWVLAMLVLSVAVWLLDRRSRPDDRVAATPPVPASIRGSARVQVLAAVLATVAAVGAVVQVARIGESGSRAVWTGVVRTS
jgi:hypothetical protein